MSILTERLFPAPRALRPGAGELRLDHPIQLVLGPGAQGWADTLLDRLAWLRVRPPSGAAAGPEGAITLRVDAGGHLAPEAFELEVDPGAGVRILAGSLDGAAHATVTLRQLLPADAYRVAPLHRDCWTLPEVWIADEPAQQWRGFLLDVARHFTPKDELLRIVERLAMHRLNRLHLHLTDDQGWRFASRAYPAIAEVASWRSQTALELGTDPVTTTFDGTPHGGFYTAEDLAEITAHARAHGIQIVPEVDLPAHASALLAAVPELRLPGIEVPEVAARFGILPRLVSPLPPGREVLATLLGELADAVDSPYLHLGGDEASLTDWDGCAEVRAYRQRRALATSADLRVDLTAFLVEQVNGLGRRPVVWEEAFEAGGIDDRTIVMAWRAETLGQAAMAAGHDVVMMPMDSRYLDYAETPEDGLAIGSGLTLERIGVYQPTAAAGPGQLLGTEAALWTEFVPDARSRAARMFPRLAVHAATAWTGRALPAPLADPGFAAALERMAAAGIEYRPPAGPLPWQRGGTGRRRSVSTLTVTELASMVELMLAQQSVPGPDVDGGTE